MSNIKFLNTNSVVLINDLSGVQIEPASSGENFIEFSFNSLSKDSSDFYHFVITGSNVQVSGTINSVTTDYQFFSLFSGCSQITDASQLQITAPTMKFFCFGNMFKDCTNLINPPSVEATTLADWCYQGMFAGCSKMTSAPQLPATTLAPYCYYAMFYGCKALTSAPYLSASTLVDWCYNSMFFNCQSLTSISADFIDWNTSGNSTKNWVTGIETIGNFYNDNVDFIHSDDNVPEKWKPDYSTTPLTFKGKAATNAICLSAIGSPEPISLQYSQNGRNWTSYTIGDVIELTSGDTVAFSGANNHFSKSIINYYNFALTGTIEAKGNIQSLMNFSNNAPYCCYDHLFVNCSSLVTPPVLPAATLDSCCYNQMFSGCTSLTKAPQLPATTLAPLCYEWMFVNCSSLLSAPKLLAPELKSYCYMGMFTGCTQLSSIQVAFTNWNVSYATQVWLGGVAANGTFTKPNDLPLSTGVDYIPEGWTVINK